MTAKKKDLEPLFFPQTEHERKTDAEPFLKCTWRDVFDNIHDIQKEKNSVEKALERFQPSRWWKETAWNAKTIREGRLSDAAGRMEFRRPPGCVTRWEALAWLDFCMAFTYAALAKGSEDDLRALKDKYIDQPEGLSMGVFKGWIDSYRMLPKTPMRDFLDAKFRRAAEEVKLRSSEKTEPATTGGSEITFLGSEDKIEVSAKGGLYLTSTEEERLIKAREELILAKKIALDEQPATDDWGSARERKFEKGWTDDMEKGWEVGIEFETRMNENAEARTIEDLKKAEEIAHKEVEGFDWQVYWDNLRATPAPSTGQ
ncbi:hypothetical protein B0I37DRAFT_374386 [Chaetomium sp. MPI-CAGE-AT-0009]|nr:hypothetical protein B0I37DRAFT_374386 [Chaetomium sp. MPI-CAGE-AT-0009]